KIRPIQDVEGFRNDLALEMISDAKRSTHSHVQRGEVKASPGISRNTCGTIIEVRVEVAIRPRLNVERQRRRIAEDVTQRKSSQRLQRAFGAVRCFKGPAHREALSLIVVRQSAIVSQVKIILRRREKEVARVVERLRVVVRHSKRSPAPSAFAE